MTIAYHIACLCGHGQNEHHDANYFQPPDPSFCGGCEEERPTAALHRFVQAHAKAVGYTAREKVYRRQNELLKARIAALEEALRHTVGLWHPGGPSIPPCQKCVDAFALVGTFNTAFTAAAPQSVKEKTT